MNPLRHALIGYLAVRRALGYTLVRPEKLLAQLLSYVEARGETHLCIETIVAWATLPRGTDRSWCSLRLSVARGFASHVHAIDPVTEVPPTDLLPWHRCRATPYLYSDDDVAALLATTEVMLRPAHRVATYRTLIGLLAATGLRVGEALALDCEDVDAREGVLTIRRGKFGKSRELPVQASTMDALRHYLGRRDRPRAEARTPAVFVSTAGTRLLYCNVHWTFHRVVHRASLTPRSAACRPRIHDLRHRFAVATILDSYRQGEDPQARLALLSTYLGHVDPRHTYWYLSAAPELLGLAGDRLQRHLGGAS
jgi:integrase